MIGTFAAVSMKVGPNFQLTMAHSISYDSCKSANVSKKLAIHKKI